MQVSLRVLSVPQNSQATELISLSAACPLRQPICPTYHLPDTQGLVAESRSLDGKRRRLTEVIAPPSPTKKTLPCSGSVLGVCGSHWSLRNGWLLTARKDMRCTQSAHYLPCLQAPLGGGTAGWLTQGGPGLMSSFCSEEVG